MANTITGLSPVWFPFNRNPVSSYKPRLLPSFKQNLNSTFHISQPYKPRVLEVVTPKQKNRFCSVFGSLSDGSEEVSKVGSVDIKVPRRSLQVEFTCDSCGERTKRLINRLAYERGVVYVQCGGCSQYHKLVDNLGLVVEYDFREETAKDSGTGQV